MELGDFENIINNAIRVSIINNILSRFEIEYVADIWNKTLPNPPIVFIEILFIKNNQLNVYQTYNLLKHLTIKPFQNSL